MILLLASAVQLVPTVAARTPASVTVPGYQVSCAVTDLTGNLRYVAFAQSGGRGYEDKRADRVGYAVRRTNVQLQVLRDDTRMFAGYEFMGGMLSDEQARWVGVRKFQRGSKTTQIESFATRDPKRIAILIEPDWPYGFVAATGFCDLEASQQQPLTQAETENWLSR